MRTVCWSVKGGSGTTVAATAIALLLGRRSPVVATLLDLGGDVTSVLGLASAEFGLDDWLASPDAVGTDALDGLAIEAAEGLRVIPGARENAPVRASRIASLVAWLNLQTGPVVVDLGVRRRRDCLADAIFDGSDRSLLVTRACYLSLHHATTAPYRPTGVVLVREPGRALDEADVEASLGVPVVASVDLDPAIARAVDAGLLNTRLPRPLARSLRNAA